MRAVGRLTPVLAACACVAAVAGCGGSGSKAGGTLLIAVDAPFSSSPYIGKTIGDGVQLAVDELNAQGGVSIGGKTYTFRVKRYDNALSPRRAVANVRRAIRDDAIAIVDDGTGVDASWQIARDAGVPICITYGGGVGLVDEEKRPNVFRIAPTDRGISFRLAEYLVPKGLKLALLHDDTPYGQEGGRALAHAFSRNPEAVALRLTLPAGATDLSPQVLRARRAGATGLLVWGEGATIAETLIAARSAGWGVPVYAPPSAEEPIVRQQLADRPEWLDGLTFASGRMTAELGPGFFYAFQSKYEAAYGAQEVGVETRAGKSVVAPPDYAMYSYDFVNVLAAAVRQAGEPGEKLVAALEQVTVRGANGDERGFNEHNHDGVVDDDVYFARFEDMTFRPVKDDPLSATLPVVQQVR
jgi:ABC-type branched-subunit amino acid transport system substrate-binding protein